VNVLTVVSFLLALALIIMSNTDLPLAQDMGLSQISPALSEGPDANTRIDTKGFTVSFASLVSILAVFIFYYARFATWPTGGDERLKTRPTRFYTTGVRYGIFAVMYAMGMVLFFFFANQFPDYFSALVAAMGAGGNLQSGQLPQAELLAYTLAFFLVVWPNIPVIDDSIRRILQENAGIPFEADSLVNSFLSTSGAAFTPDSEIVDQVLSWNNVKKYLSPGDFEVTATGDSLEFNLARIGYVIATLQRLAGQKSYSRALKSQDADYQQIVNGFDSILELALSASGDVGTTIHRKLIKDAKALLRKAYDLVVCSVLTVEGSPAARRQGFRKFGFELSVRDPLPVDANIIIKLLGLAFLSVCIPTILIFVFLASTETSQSPLVDRYIPKGYPEALWWSAFGATMHIVAAVIGVFVVRSAVLEERAAWNAEQPNQRPTAEIDASHVVHYTTAAILGFSVNVILLGLFDIFQPQSVVRGSWMWAIVPGVTSWFVAYNLAHLVSVRGKLRIGLRSVAHGLGTAGFAVVVGFLAVLGEGSRYPSPRGLWFMAFAGASAFFVGYIVSKTVLEWYRRRWSASGEEIIHSVA
jgi:hypothetical protein